MLDASRILSIPEVPLKNIIRYVHFLVENILHVLTRYKSIQKNYKSWVNTIFQCYLYQSSVQMTESDQPLATILDDKLCIYQIGIATSWKKKKR